MSSNESISSRHDLIRKYICVIDDDVEYFMCAVCRNVLIDPRQAILCGCRFCLACLQELFRNGNEFCPGMSCKFQRLSSMDDVHSDDGTNSKIEKLAARCLVNGCRVEGSFRGMMEHVVECSKELSIDNRNDSVTLSTETPACLQERVDTIGKAMEGVKMNVDNILQLLSMADERIRSLDEKVKTNEMQIATHKDNVDKMRKEINQKDDEILRLKQGLKEIKAEVARDNDTVVELRDDINLNDDEILMLKQGLKEVKAQIVRDKKTVDKMKKEINQKDDEISMLKNELNALKAQKGMKEFIWKVTSYSEQRTKGLSLKSEEFYTFKHGYKMKLLFYPNGSTSSYGTDLSLFYQLVPGEWDDILDWPFRHNVVLSLLDQSVNGRHKIFTITTHGPESSQKPNKKPNVGYGYPLFVEINRLIIDGFLKNDTLFISCRLEKKEDDT